MKFTTLPGALVAALLLVAPATVAGKTHRHHGRLAHIFDHPRPSPEEASFFETSSSKAKRVAKKRGGSCPFPTDDPNLVAVTPDEKNAGWAMSPDQECEPGNYCPFACKPGMVMNQWEPDSTYSYPSSMNGGLYCNDDGEIEKPFKGKPNCVTGSGAVQAVNKCGSQMSWCQTVLPGNEAMLIPTLVSSSATIAVPDTSYWCSTAAHFYINPPGTGEEGCIWGDESQPIGNWSPYVAGANTEANGETFVKLGWNPIWEDSPLKKTLPDFGIEIKCPDGGCNGLPCKIDPSDGEGTVSSDESAVGAGGSAFCVVTVPKGSTAQIVAFSVGSGSSDSDSDDDDSESETTSKTPTPTPTPTSTSTTAEKKTTSTKETTTSKATTTKESTTSSTPTEESTTTTSTPKESKAKTTKSTSTTTQFTRKTKSASDDEDEDEDEDEDKTTTSHKSHPTVNPGIFRENGTTTAVEGTATNEATATNAGSQAAPTTSKEGDAVRHQGSAAFASFVVAFIAAVCFF